MENQDMSLPEGFVADANGNFMGIPPWAMREANALMAAVTNNRSWDVPMVAKALSTIFDHRMNEILANVKQAVEQSVAALNSERHVSVEALTMPLDAPLRLSANPESAKNLPCPICQGVEGCDHTVSERERVANANRAKQRLAQSIGGQFDVVTQKFSILDMEGGVDYDKVVANFAAYARNIDNQYGIDTIEREPLHNKPIDFGDLPHLKNRLPLEEVEGFWMPADMIGHIVKLNLYDLIERAKHAHYCDVVMRTGGRDIRIQADWIKYMVPMRKAPNDDRILQRRTRAVLVDAADVCQALANGYVSDVNPERSSERSDGASACAKYLMDMAVKLPRDTEDSLDKATLAFLGKKADEPYVSIDWWAERRFRFSEWKAHLRHAIKVYTGTSL